VARGHLRAVVLPTQQLRQFGEVRAMRRASSLVSRHTGSISGARSPHQEADNRVERSLYMRANGFHYDAVKIFCDKNGRVPKVPYRECVIPDVTACIFWLKNRDPQHWRDVQNVTHVLGKYIISDRPMTEEQWAEERADVLDVEPLPDSATLASASLNPLSD
jgi:hypothetical protein